MTATSSWSPAIKQMPTIIERSLGALAAGNRPKGCAAETMMRRARSPMLTTADRAISEDGEAEVRSRLSHGGHHHAIKQNATTGEQHFDGVSAEVARAFTAKADE